MGKKEREIIKQFETKDIVTVELLRSQPFKLKAQTAAKPRPFILLSIIKLVAKTPTLDAIINCLRVLLT